MICKLCQQEVEDVRAGICFDCASAQVIIGKILQEEKPIKTNTVIKGLSKEGYVICERKFLEQVCRMGKKNGNRKR